ncbi:MAG: nucleotidyltransferase family protein [Myxococcales bacterium]
MTGDAVAGVVLAAGLSTRMGANKMLIELGGRSLVQRAVSTALAAGLDPVLVVVGHERERVQEELMGLRCTPVFNPDYARGIHASLKAGIAALPAGTKAAAVLLGDMPLVDAPMVRALVDAFRRGGSPLAVSLYGEVVAPPIVYAEALFAELRDIDGDGCGKRVVKRHRAEAIELRWPEETLTDLDSPEDVARVRARLEAA